jgi:long-chain fatty acid transport protein
MSDVGTRGMSRAGAFIAGADDLSAQYYNPAALIRLRRPQLYVSYSQVSQPIEFTRKDYDASGALDNTWDMVSNEAKPMHIPNFGVSHHFGLKNTMFALGLFSPFAPRYDYPEEGGQRYTMKDAEFLQFYAGPSVAHRIGWLTLGAGVYWTQVRADQTLDLAICSTAFDAAEQNCNEENLNQPDGETQIYDVGVELSMADRRRITWNIGLLAEPKEWISIGYSAQPRLDVSGTGTIKAEFEEGHWMTDPDTPLPIIKGSKHSDDDVTVNLVMPWIHRFGVAFHDADRNWEVEGAMTYQRWQVTEEITVTNLNLVLPVTDEVAAFDVQDIVIDDDIILPADYVDTFSYRLGGHYRVIDPLLLRAGVLYEGSAVPAATQGVNLMDGNKWAVGFGGSYSLFNNALDIDLGLLRTWYPEREINDSIVARQELPVGISQAVQDPTLLEDLELGPGQVVGNGTTSAKSLFLSTAITWRFGQTPRSK